MTHHYDMIDTHGTEFFANVAQVWSYRMLPPIWNHWSSNLLLHSASVNVTLLTIGKMNSTEIDYINVVTNRNNLQTQAFMRSQVIAFAIFAFRVNHPVLQWCSILLILVALFYPYPDGAKSE
jgi:hypothetical protein